MPTTVLPATRPPKKFGTAWHVQPIASPLCGTSYTMRGAAAALVICLAAFGGCGTSASGGAGASDAAGDVTSAGEDAMQGDSGLGTDAADAPASSPDADGSSADAEASSPDAGGSPADAANDTRSDAAGASEAGGSACAAATDCRKLSDYCGGCNCLALGAHEPDPTCDAGTANCFADPCSGHAAACGATGRCVIQ